MWYLQDNHQLDAAKIQYEVDELQRRADAAKMKLTAEMKVGLVEDSMCEPLGGTEQHHPSIITPN